MPSPLICSASASNTRETFSAPGIGRGQDGLAPLSPTTTTTSAAKRGDHSDEITVHHRHPDAIGQLLAAARGRSRTVAGRRRSGAVLPATQVPWMITNCGPFVFWHDAKGPQVVITRHRRWSSDSVPASIWVRTSPSDSSPYRKLSRQLAHRGCQCRSRFRRVIRGAFDLGHHRHCHLTGGQPASRVVAAAPAHRGPAPGRAATPTRRPVRRRRRCGHPGPVLDRGHRRRIIVDVGERPDPVPDPTSGNLPARTPAAAGYSSRRDGRASCDTRSNRTLSCPGTWRTSRCWPAQQCDSAAARRRAGIES